VSPKSLEFSLLFRLPPLVRTNETDATLQSSLWVVVTRSDSSGRGQRGANQRSDPREHRLAEVALARNGSSATVGDGLAEACQRSPPSYDDGAADGTAGLAGRQIRALVQGEAASSTSVPARSADNGNRVHNVKIAVVA